MTKMTTEGKETIKIYLDNEAYIVKKYSLNTNLLAIREDLKNNIDFFFVMKDGFKIEKEEEFDFYLREIIDGDTLYLRSVKNISKDENNLKSEINVPDDNFYLNNSKSKNDIINKSKESDKPPAEIPIYNNINNNQNLIKKDNNNLSNNNFINNLNNNNYDNKLYNGSYNNINNIYNNPNNNNNYNSKNNINNNNYLNNNNYNNHQNNKNFDNNLNNGNSYNNNYYNINKNKEINLLILDNINYLHKKINKLNEDLINSKNKNEKSKEKNIKEIPTIGQTNKITIKVYVNGNYQFKKTFEKDSTLENIRDEIIKEIKSDFFFLLPDGFIINKNEEKIFSVEGILNEDKLYINCEDIIIKMNNQKKKKKKE